MKQDDAEELIASGETVYFDFLLNGKDVVGTISFNTKAWRNSFSELVTSGEIRTFGDADLRQAIEGYRSRLLDSDEELDFVRKLLEKENASIKSTDELRAWAQSARHDHILRLLQIRYIERAKAAYLKNFERLTAAALLEALSVAQGEAENAMRELLGMVLLSPPDLEKFVLGPSWKNARAVLGVRHGGARSRQGSWTETDKKMLYEKARELEPEWHKAYGRFKQHSARLDRACAVHESNNLPEWLRFEAVRRWEKAFIGHHELAFWNTDKGLALRQAHEIIVSERSLKTLKLDTLRAYFRKGEKLSV